MDYSTDQPERAVIVDNDGNAFIVAQALGPNWLLIQKIDRYGDVLWAEPNTAQKVAINMSGDDAGYSPILVSDQNGGCYIAYAYGNFNSLFEGQYLWFYDYDVYVQHITKDCERPWGSDGVVIAAKDSVTGEYPHGLAWAGDGGVFVLFSGEKTVQGSPFPTTYVQRLSLNGELMWSEYGNIISAVDTFGVTRILSDENGGAFLFGNSDYAQRLNAEGEFMWSLPFISTGLPKFSKFWIFRSFEEFNSSITVIGGWIAAAQFSFLEGSVFWRSDIDAWIPEEHRFSYITSNGKGGQYIFHETLFQEISAEGKFIFADPKVALGLSQIEGAENYYPVSGEHADGIGTFVLYSSYRTSNEGKLVVQKIDNNGNLPWGPNGITVCDTNVFLSQESILRIDTRHSEAFIFTVFEDGIFVTKLDLHTGQNITRVNKRNDKTTDSFQIGANPNPFRHSIRLELPGNLINSTKSLKIYNITGKEVIDLSQKINASSSIVEWDGKDMWNQEVAAGVYFVKVILDRIIQTIKILKL